MADPTLAQLAAELTDTLVVKVTPQDIVKAAAVRCIPLRDGRVPERKVADIYLEVQARVRSRSQMQEVIDDYFTFEAATRR